MIQEVGRERDSVLIRTYDHEAIAVEKLSTYHTYACVSLLFSIVSRQLEYETVRERGVWCARDWF